MLICFTPSSIALLWSGVNISLLLTYSYLSVLADNNDGIPATSLVILCFIFWSLILSSTVVINYYVLSKRLYLKRKWLSNPRVVLFTKKEYDFAVHFC